MADHSALDSELPVPSSPPPNFGNSHTSSERSRRVTIGCFLAVAEIAECPESPLLMQ